MPGHAPIRKAHEVCGCGTIRWITPCPSFPRQGWRSWSFFSIVLAGGKFGFDTFNETLNVGVVLINNQQGRRHSAENNNCWWSMMRGPQKINEQWHSRS